MVCAVDRALAHIRKKIEEELNGLDGSRKLSLLPPDHGYIQLSDKYRKLSVEAAYVVYSNEEGLLGVFRGFTASPSQSPKSACREIYDQAKQVVQELDLMFSAASEDREARPWIVYLFAVVPGLEEQQAFTRGLNELIFEPYNPLLRIGVSLITADQAKDQENLSRFLAPLLVTTRKLAHSDPSRLRAAHGQKLLEKLQACLAETPAEDSGGPAAGENPAAAVRRRIVTEIIQRLGDAVERLELKPPTARLMSIREIDNLCYFRRFDEPRALHFKKKNLVFGLNGSGKSSLVEVLELALTGQVKNLQAVKPLDSNKEPAAVTKVVLNDEAGPTVEQRLFESPPLLSQAAFRTFCLLQPDYHRFVQCAPEERSEFLATALGMPVDKLFQGLHEMLEELRRIARSRYPEMNKDRARTYERSFRAALQSKLAGVVRKDEFNKAWELFEKVNQNLRNLLNTYPAIYEETYESVRDLANKTAKWGQQCDGILAMLAAGPVPQSRLEQAASFLTQPKERAAAALAAVQRSLSNLEGPIRTYLAMETEHVKTNVPSKEELAMKQALLQRVQYAISFLRELEPVRESTRNVTTSLDTWWSKLQSFLATEPPAQDKGEFSPGVHSKLIEIRNFARAVATRTSWAEHIKALRELEACLSEQVLTTGAAQLEQKRRELTTQVAQLQVAFHGPQAAEPGHRRDLVLALAACGLEVSEALINPTTVQVLQSYLTAVSRLSAALDSLWDQAAWEKVTDTLLHFYDRPEAGSNSPAGAYYYFTYLDLLEEKQGNMREAVEAWLRDVQKEIEKSFLEFLYLLTSFSWGFRYPSWTFKIERNNRMQLELKFNNKVDADAILNQAEKSLVGLSWFLTAYLLAGREYSNVLILDDPFQHLDETNIGSFMRVLDLMDRVFNVGQIIVTLHERNHFDSLLRLWAVIPSRLPDSTDFGTATACIILRQNESFTSDIQEFHLCSRHKSVPLDELVESKQVTPRQAERQLAITFPTQSGYED